MLMESVAWSNCGLVPGRRATMVENPMLIL
jgi:hypothetical protein